MTNIPNIQPDARGTTILEAPDKTVSVREVFGIDIDMESVEKANRLYEKQGKGARNDAMAMQYLMPGWKYDPKRPAFLFKE